MDTRIRPGMHVLSSDGLALGTVANVDAGGFTLAGGNIVHGEHRITAFSIAGVFAGEIYLRSRAADVAAMSSEREVPLL